MKYYPYDNINKTYIEMRCYISNRDKIVFKLDTKGTNYTLS